MATLVNIPAPALFPIRDPFFMDKQNPGPINRPWANWFQLLETLRTKSAQFFFGTSAQRSQANAAKFPNGSVFFESDRRVFYVVINGQWVFLTGTMQDSLANIPTSLATADQGFLFFATDYQHQLIWNGVGWTWAPGENGSGYIVPFVSAPFPLEGWHACDGTTVPQMNSDASLTQATLPVTSGSWFRQ